MTSFDYDKGILGGGSAGLTIAAGAAQFGAKALLIEKEKVLGGDCFTSRNMILLNGSAVSAYRSSASMQES